MKGNHIKENQKKPEQELSRQETSEVKYGYIACVGRPNVGKSTLINTLVGTKISAVSPKPQTTRRSIIGIKTIREDGKLYQLVFIDTPGIHKPKDELGSQMVKHAIDSLKSANVVYHLVDSSEGIQGEDIDVFENLKHILGTEGLNPAVFCVLTKIDLIKKEKLLPMMEEIGKWNFYKEIIPVSALKSLNLQELISYTLKYLPQESEIHFPEDTIFGLPLRILVQEVIMEKIYNYTHMEIPYSTAVDIEEVTHRGNKVIYIKATIYVERPGQKKIIIGEDGSKIKQIGTLAREELELLTGKKVYLDLWVKVRGDWRKNIHFVKKVYFSD
ncbi:MAG: GTPase Era [Candidatus Calescibacterium sp.]|nr:GTPase Era [Candidatus Calescibacterium sp.]MCX7734809.1 GTPase Era [bacterium]MDW8087420.1 GTPase Era [Candidatus Calescibacterium sp.]